MRRRDFLYRTAAALAMLAAPASLVVRRALPGLAGPTKFHPFNPRLISNWLGWVENTAYRRVVGFVDLRGQTHPTP